MDKEKLTALFLEELQQESFLLSVAAVDVNFMYQRSHQILEKVFRHQFVLSD